MGSFFDFNLNLIFLIAIVAFAQSLANIASQFLLREKKYTKFAIGGILQNLGALLAQYLLSLKFISAYSLVIGYVVGRLILVVTLILDYPIKYLDVCRRYRFPVRTIFKFLGESKILVFSNFLDMLTIAIPVLFLGWHYGPDKAAYLSVTQTLMYIPMTLIGGGIGSLILGEFSKSIDQESGKTQSKDLVSYYTYPVALISLFYCFFSVFFPVHQISYLLGTNWDSVSLLVPILGFPNALAFLWYPFSTVLVASRRFKNLMILSLCRFVLTLVSVGLSLYLEIDWEHSAFWILMAGSSVSFYAFYKFIVRRN
jgi:O-antigen/teichoic acid export membrane protein